MMKTLIFFMPWPPSMGLIISTRTSMGLLKVGIFKIVWALHLNISMYAIIQKKTIIILKLDFEKAFDKVEYKAIIAMLKAKGFVPRWINWVTNILHSASTSVLLNGVAGKKNYL